MCCHSVGPSGLAGFEQRGFGGKAGCIISPYRPLSRLTASHHSRKASPALREEAEFRRSLSTEGVSGPVDRRKLSQKLTAAHSGSTGLRVAEDEPVAVYYEPRACEQWPELEEAA